MPFKLEKWGDKAIVTNTQTGKHYSTEPIPLLKAKAQMRVLQQATRTESDPCWKGYEMIGMKEKGGRKVPNCVPEKDDPPKRWIQKVVSSPKFKKGAFTAEASKAGMSTKGYMKEVLAHPEEHSVTTRRRAQFMKNVEH